MSWRNKSNYKNMQNKKKRFHELEPGISGFLCTCNSKFRERDCVREAYNILNEFADKLFGPESKPNQSDNEPETEKKDKKDCEDIEDSLKKEVESLKSEFSKKPEERRFQAVESGANGIVFIRSTVTDPVKLAHYIVTSLVNVQKSKFLLRLLPVEVTCKAYLDDICAACDPLFDKYFTGEEKTFGIIFNHRNNDRLKRTEVVDKLAEMVAKKNEKNKADLKHPQLAVLVEVIRSICCISVVPEFYSLKKYNLLELSSNKTDSSKGETEETEPKENIE